MRGAPIFSSQPSLARLSIAVENAAQAQAVQTFLWGLWLTALNTPATTTSRSNASGIDRTLFQRSSYEYDSFGCRIKSTATFYDAAGALNARASATNHLTGKYPTTNTKFLIGDSTCDLTDTREYGDPRCRMPTKVTDAHGNFATMEYDGFCRKVRESAYAKDSSGANAGLLTKQTTYALTDLGAGNAERHSQTVNSSDDAQSTAYYDNLQRAIRGQSKNFDGTLVEASTVFDARGRQSQVTKPISSSMDDIKLQAGQIVET